MATFTYGTTSGMSAAEIAPNGGLKVVQIKVPATFVWGTDSIAVDLATFGATRIAGFIACEETTEGSVVVCASTGTTSVSTTTLTYVSTGMSANTDIGSLILFIY